MVFKRIRNRFNAYIRKGIKTYLVLVVVLIRLINGTLGHFLAAGNYSFLRFNEDNVHKQCSANCNGFKSGIKTNIELT